MSDTEATTTALLVGRVLARRVRTANRKAAETAEQVEARFSGVDLALEGLTSTDEALEARIASVSDAVEAVKADEERTYGELRVTDAQVAAIASDIAIIAGRVTANDAIDAAQDAELTGLTGRVEGLEARAPVPGPPGPKGERGPAGPAGRTAYGGGGGSATIQSAGTLVANRPVINFVSGATVADDATNNRVNVTVSGGGNVNSVSVSSGLSITGTSDLTITNTGVRSLAGSGISVSGSGTGDVTITAPVVAGGTGISVSGSGSTSLTVSATGVNSVSAGTGISVSGTTALTVSATGVNSIAAGTGISVSGSTSLTVTNTGVTSLAGTGVSVSSSTGNITITAPVVAGGTGISVSGSQTTSLSITNTGVTSIVAGTGISVSGATGAVTVTSSGGGSAITRIYTTTLASDTASVNITAIPQTYTHLELIVHAAGTSYVRTVGIYCVPYSAANTANYLANGYEQQQFWSGSSSGTGSILNFTSDFTAGIMPGGQSNPGPAQYLFGMTKIFFANYSSATSSKGWVSEAHHSGTNNGSVNTSTLFHGAAHFSTTASVQLGAIDRLYVYPTSGNFRTGSVFTLYGWS